MKKTPLHAAYAHQEGVKLVNFGGWELPIQFSQGILAEHHGVRSGAGLFDVSHMGEFAITGSHAKPFLQYLLSSDIANLQNGQAKYGLLCYPHGGVVDDVLVYQFAEDSFWLVVNAGNREKDFRWVTEENPWVLEGRPMPTITDISDDIVQLALQGPKAVELLASALFEASADSADGLAADRGDPDFDTAFNTTPVAQATAITTLKPFEFLPKVTIAGVHAVVSRTGYTGEDGVEIYFSLKHNAPPSRNAQGSKNLHNGEEIASRVWDFLLNLGGKQKNGTQKHDSQEGGSQNLVDPDCAPVIPCGLGCRDTLRLEAKMPLYGHELSEHITPLEANLSWAVALQKEDFCGKGALVKQKAEGIPRSLRGVIMKDKAVAREGNQVFLENTAIGVVTSGAKSPTGGYFCALVLIQRGLGLTIGDEVTIDIRGKKRVATLVKTPFYKRGTTT